MSFIAASLSHLKYYNPEAIIDGGTDPGVVIGTSVHWPVFAVLSRR